VAGDFVFVAGQTARDAATGKMIDGDISAQPHRCIDIEVTAFRGNPNRR
jgi:enamine deaminase RidA (YjgF/YER057c/UK114 family)